MQKSKAGDAVGHALVSAAERIQAAERPSRVLYGLITALLLVSSTAIVYHTGGTYLPYLHIFYVPIITANFLLGPAAGAITAVIASSLVGWIPLNVVQGTLQAPAMIFFRAFFFVLVSVVAGIASHVARVHIEKLQEKVREKTAALEKSYQDLKDLQEAKEFLTSTIVHDLRSSLASTILSCEVLKKKYEDVMHEDGKVLMATALSSGRRTLDMISNILDVYTRERKALEPKYEPWEAGEALHQAASDFIIQAAHKKVALTVEIPGDFQPVQADRELMRRILANLLYNAMSHTPSGGAVTLGALMKDGAVELSVSNTGSFIPPEWREKIFEKFARIENNIAGRAGSGLGLSFCRMAVEAHGGRIWAESQRDGDISSTTFRFTIPASLQ
jgi:signal transduction histidine kinase